MGVTPQHKDSEKRIEGFLEQWSLAPKASSGYRIIYGEGYHDVAYARTRDALNEMPNITGIFVSGAGLSGVAQAVYERGTADVQKVVGFDATQRNITYMKNGTVQFLIDQSPYQQGYKAVQLLVDYLFEGRAPDVSCYYLDAHIKNAFNC